MVSRKSSAMISLIICCISVLVLLVWLFSFPSFFNWFYCVYHGLSAQNEHVRSVINLVVASFYCCCPFAGGALYMLIRLLLNIIKDKVFVKSNIMYLRLISYCCFGVFIITFIAGIKYFPLFIIAFAMAVVGMLLRVVKNVMHSAVEIKEENELTV